jgi:hypothetical protein
VKKNRFVVVIISIFLIVIVGCSMNTNLVVSKENLKSADKKVKIFMDRYNDKNGIYSYQDGTNEMYLFLNGFNVKNGEKASYFTDIKMEVNEETLIINFNEKYTDDYENKVIDNRVLYKIKQPKNVYTIRIYKNGQETHFDVIGN